jgi:hypothetical protein
MITHITPTMPMKHANRTPPKGSLSMMPPYLFRQAVYQANYRVIGCVNLCVVNGFKGCQLTILAVKDLPTVDRAMPIIRHVL